MKVYAKALLPDLLRILLLPLYIFPVKKNRILFTGLTGGTTNEYSCNPMYLCEYLLANEPGKYEIIWAVSAPEKYRNLEEKGIRLIRHFSFGSFRWLLSAKVVVTNGSYTPWFPFRKQQYVINTWHGGGAYKKIENSKPNANWATRHRAKFCAQNMDLFVSTCRMATTKLIQGSFGYMKEVAEIGMPRNDFLIKGDLTQARQHVREYYHLDGTEKIVLYAPTYRYGEKEVTLDVDRLLAHLEQKGERWVFLRRAHRYQDEKMKIRCTGERILEASSYPDMQELLAAADIMITDYSSNIWDYSFLHRPCFLFVPDLEEYLAKTGFFVDIHQWPYDMAKDQDELEALIDTFDQTECDRKIKAHHELMGCTETGESCSILSEKIKEICSR